MANPMPPTTGTGTFGELLVQIRLLQFDVQAAPPLRDSGNDLIALRGYAIRCIQVKTSTGGPPSWPDEEKAYHLLAVVHLIKADREVRLDESKVYLLERNDRPACRRWEDLAPFELSQARVEALFQ